MPAPVSLAASFDPNTAQQYGQTVGAAARATDQDVWLGPMVNEVNYPTAGRNFETLGEDPYLAGQIAAGEVTGAQAEGLITELKHYIENDFENGRTSTNVVIDDQTLHETELLAFQTAINAGAGSVMCSYNRINYVYGCGNSTTIGDVLREQLAFGGFVQSDWGAVHKTTDLVNGDDIEQPNGSNFSVAALTADVTNGTPAVAATADYPAYPAITGAAMEAGARQRRVPDPHHDEQGRPVGRHPVRFALHRYTHPMGTAPTGLGQLADQRREDRPVHRRGRRDAAEERQRRATAGQIRRQERWIGRDGADRVRHVLRRWR